MTISRGTEPSRLAVVLETFVLFLLRRLYATSTRLLDSSEQRITEHTPDQHTPDRYTNEQLDRILFETRRACARLELLPPKQIMHEQPSYGDFILKEQARADRLHAKGIDPDAEDSDFAEYEYDLDRSY